MEPESVVVVAAIRQPQALVIAALRDRIIDEAKPLITARPLAIFVPIILVSILGIITEPSHGMVNLMPFKIDHAAKDLESLVVVVLLLIFGHFLEVMIHHIIHLAVSPVTRIKVFLFLLARGGVILLLLFLLGPVSLAGLVTFVLVLDLGFLLFVLALVLRFEVAVVDLLFPKEQVLIVVAGTAFWTAVLFLAFVLDKLDDTLDHKAEGNGYGDECDSYSDIQEAEFDRRRQAGAH